VVQLSVKALIGSKLSLDLVGAALPGGVSSSWLRSKIKIAIENEKRACANDTCHLDTMLIFNN